MAQGRAVYAAAIMAPMRLLLALPLLCAACRELPAEAPRAVDLRPELVRLGFPPRAQGARPTCSVFTTCSALEFALAHVETGSGRMSPEFLNWAANQSSHDSSDGDFFHQALAGFEREGLCREDALPYAAAWDPAMNPPQAVLEAAHALRERTRSALAIHWLVPWVPNRFGLSEEQFAAVKRTLAAGWPVAAGSGHSRLLVGYREDPLAEGGGTFITCDSGLAAWGEVSFAFVRQDVADVFWVEGRAP
jgi:hypothetical protein